MIKMITGNLIELAERGDYTHVLHGCNCMCTMGAGVAHSIALSWPEAAVVDKATVRGDRSKLGKLTSATILRPNRQFEVFNLYTQYRYGPAREMHFDLDAFRQSLTGFTRVVPPEGVRILTPMIGSGNGGGRIRHVKHVMEEVLIDYDVTICKLK